MTPEMQKAYADAAVPFYERGGAITAEVCRVNHWRV